MRCEQCPAGAGYRPSGTSRSRLATATMAGGPVTSPQRPRRAGITCSPRSRIHLEAFLQAVADQGDGGGLPRFVEQEFRDFLRCGVLAQGFTRLRCPECAFERLVPFSCKRRGFCPNWRGRRMAEHAAYLVDEVLPQVPVRQWVLTLPYRVRYRLAWDHALCRAVLGVYARVLLAFYARSAHAQGIRDGQTGTVTVIQRFGDRRSYCDLLHEQSLDRLLRAVQGRRNGAARRSSLAAVSSAISSHHTRRCAWKSLRSPGTSPRLTQARITSSVTPKRLAAPATE